MFRYNDELKCVNMLLSFANFNSCKSQKITDLEKQNEVYIFGNIDKMCERTILESISWFYYVMVQVLLIMYREH